MPDRPLDSSPYPIVDDFLIRRHQERAKIDQVLDKWLKNPPKTNRTVRRLGEKLNAMGPMAIDILLQHLDSGVEAHTSMAITLLMNLPPNEDTDQVLRQHLERSDLSDDARNILGSVLDARLYGEDLDDIQNRFITDPVQTLGSLFNSYEREFVVANWREIRPLMKPEMLSHAIGVFLKNRLLAAIPIFRYEAWHADASLARLLARDLPALEDPEIHTILSILTAHPDLEARNDAMQALQNLPPLSPSEALPGSTVRSRGLLDYANGMIAIEHVRRIGDDFRGLMAMIDVLDQGLREIIFFEGEQKTLWEDSLEDHGDQPWILKTDLDDNAAAYLVRQAVHLTEERGYAIPDDYWDCEHLLPYPYTKPDSIEVPRFGWDCAMCRKPIKTGPRRKMPYLIQNIAICPRCARRKQKCVVCGQRVAILGAMFFTDDSQNLQFICGECEPAWLRDEDE